MEKGLRNAITFSGIWDFWETSESSHLLGQLKLKVPTFVVG